MKIIKSFYLRNFVWKIIYTISPKFAASYGYKRISHGNKMNWDNPVDLREKIIWLQFYSDTSLWTLCADKYRVRDFVKERGCADTLNDLYGVWNKADDIDFEKLPNSFVLKTNNSCGQVIIVKDKTKLDYSATKKQLSKWLRMKFGYVGAQMHYLRIKPVIIAERLMVNDCPASSSLVDYKIWCFNGKPEIIWVAFNRTNDSYEYSAYDLNWNNISERVLETNSAHYSGIDFPRPKSLNRMLECAAALSEGFPEVRVDYYDEKGHAMFGELTFTAGNVYFTKEYYNELGDKIYLPKEK